MQLMSENGFRPYTLVTGASSGIGLELAKQFAQNGHDLLIVAEDLAIETVAEQLRSYGGHVETFQVDLIPLQGVEKLYQHIQKSGKTLDYAALNAGAGVGGAFLETDFQREVDIIHLNIVSTIHLTKHLLRDMVSRNEGRILFTSSVVSIAPSPFQAVYGATKAFLRSFIEAIRSEIKESNVKLTALMPNATDTEFFQRADMMDTEVAQMEKDSPALVAEQGYEGLMAGDENVMGGSLKSRLQGQMARVMPKGVAAEMNRGMSEPGSAHH